MIAALIAPIETPDTQSGIIFASCIAPIEEFPVEKWNAIIAIDLTAAFSPRGSQCCI